MVWISIAKGNGVHTLTGYRRWREAYRIAIEAKHDGLAVEILRDDGSVTYQLNQRG